jgi:hypothetical protein
MEENIEEFPEWEESKIYVFKKIHQQHITIQ